MAFGSLLPGCEWLNRNLGWGPGLPGRDGREPVQETGWTGRETGWDDFVCDDCPPQFNTVSFECVPVGGGGTVEVSVDLGGWAEVVLLTLIGTRDRADTETFPFPAEANIGFCEDQTCDQWLHALRIEALGPPSVDMTTFSCSDLEQDPNGVFQNTAIRLIAVPDNATGPDECVIFGHRSREVFGAGCECIEAWLGNPPTDLCGEH